MGVINQRMVVILELLRNQIKVPFEEAILVSSLLMMKEANKK